MNIQESVDMYDWITGASYVELATYWRRSREGDPMLCGYMGEYFADMLRRKQVDFGIELAKRGGVNANERINVSGNGYYN